MAANPLIKKLQIKPGQAISIKNSPAGYIKLVGELPEKVKITEKPTSLPDLLLLFVANIADLEKLGPRAKAALKEDGIFWVAYPKKSSKVETDISRDVGWDILKKSGLRIVSAASIDNTWSALRFRPIEKVGR